MYFKKSFVLLGILFIGVNGCADIFNSDSDEVKIRIENFSEYEMKNLVVSFPDEEVEYGNINSGANSVYKEVKKAYRYAYIETYIQGKKAVLQPIDYVGESFLSPGSYTYELNFDESDIDSEGNIFLNITLVKD
ncbi:hypothetical protein [Gracilimonas sp.]|uniref:hypothetical protein n=1 Tax=Gracilimonas sp. TaxID=1974203 RepID=UPI00287233FF|nr:hypothetical protein [Gracilimonas sp.]